MADALEYSRKLDSRFSEATATIEFIRHGYFVSSDFNVALTFEDGLGHQVSNCHDVKLHRADQGVMVQFQTPIPSMQQGLTHKLEQEYKLTATNDEESKVKTLMALVNSMIQAVALQVSKHATLTK